VSRTYYHAVFADGNETVQFMASRCACLYLTPPYKILEIWHVWYRLDVEPCSQLTNGFNKPLM